MYHKAYGIIETLAPLHVGASAGEETGNLNLIFRDQFTQTGIIPGSSIRGRFRADMRRDKRPKIRGDVDYWYGHEAVAGQTDGGTTEALVKFEYASILWLPVYCPGQPVVWVSCPRLLYRYQKLAAKPKHEFQPYTYFGKRNDLEKLFFNLGFIRLGQYSKELKSYIPDALESLRSSQDLVLLVNDDEIGMIHDMALYRQSRVALDKEEKKVAGGAFFNVEALPEGTVLTFPFALRFDTSQENDSIWSDYCIDADLEQPKEMYFGGLESVGFGRTRVAVNTVS